MTIHETFVADWFLTKYPLDLSFDELCQLIEKESPKVVIWEPFENDRNITANMLTMMQALEETYGEKC